MRDRDGFLLITAQEIFMNASSSHELLQEKFKGIENKWKVIGTAIVAVVGSAVVFLAGAGIVVAGVTALVALGMVNFAIPVGARYLALARQRALTKLDEVFSEETIRADELNEANRIGELEVLYKSSRAQLEGAQEELRNQIKDANEEERVLINSQIAAIQEVIEAAGIELERRKMDFLDLQRTNKLLVAFHRSSTAMEAAQGKTRDPRELQQIETARVSIKRRLRAALAGQTIAAMNQRLDRSTDVISVAKSTLPNARLPAPSRNEEGKAS